MKMFSCFLLIMKNKPKVKKKYEIKFLLSHKLFLKNYIWKKVSGFTGKQR